VTLGVNLFIGKHFVKHFSCPFKQIVPSDGHENGQKEMEEEDRGSLT